MLVYVILDRCAGSVFELSSAAAEVRLGVLRWDCRELVFDILVQHGSGAV